MQNQRIEQVILKSGGRIDPHATPKTLQIFGEDGQPFNFGSVGEGGNTSPAGQVNHIMVHTLYINNNIDLESEPLIGALRGGEVYDLNGYFIFTAQTDEDENGVYQSNPNGTAYVKVAELSDNIVEHDIVTVAYILSSPFGTPGDASGNSFGFTLDSREYNESWGVRMRRWDDLYDTAIYSPPFMSNNTAGNVRMVFPGNSPENYVLPENLPMPNTVLAHLMGIDDHLYAAPPASGTYSLKSVDGELTWVAD